MVRPLRSEAESGQFRPSRGFLQRLGDQCFKLVRFYHLNRGALTLQHLGDEIPKIAHRRSPASCGLKVFAK